MTLANRNVVILASCQALMLSGAVLAVTAGALVGAELSADRSLATLPIALSVVGTLIATIPASLLMQRAGRRAGFVTGMLIGVAGGVVCALGIHTRSFVLFCAGFVLIGAFQGFGGYLRFAAAESVTAERKSRAISWVLAGGVVAAFLGPQLAGWGRTSFPGFAFLGSFLMLSALAAIAMVVLLGLRLPIPPPATRESGARPLSTIARQPAFVVAVVGATVGYAVMLLVMTATPLAMVGHGHEVADAVHVIQGHVLAMFAPSFVTGDLIRRFGASRVLLAGLALLAIHVVVAAAGAEFAHFFGALVLLGVGWNFSFIAGTTLLTEACSESERGKVQAANDFILSSFVALASFSSGWLLEHFGWQGVVYSGLPPLALAAGLVLWLRRGPRTQAAPAGP